MIIFGLCSSASRAMWSKSIRSSSLLDLIAHHVVGLAGKIQLVAVGEVPAMRQVEAHDGVAGLEDRRDRRPDWPAIPNAAAR